MLDFTTVGALVSTRGHGRMVWRRRVERIVVVTLSSVIVLDETTEQHLLDITFRMHCVDEIPEEI